jgi:hypothetical protein
MHTQNYAKLIRLNTVLRNFFLMQKYKNSNKSVVYGKIK